MAEAHTFIKMALTDASPPFQVEQRRITATNPDNNKQHSVPDMMVSTSLDNAKLMTTMLSNIFTNPDHMTFLSMKDFFASTPTEKIQTVLSQNHYTTTYRTFMIWNIRSIEHNINPAGQSPPQTIHLWLLRLQARSGRRLFQNVMPALSGRVEVMVHKDNEAEARSWLTGANAHIARIITTSDYPLVFVDTDITERNLVSTETWKTPGIPKFINSQPLSASPSIGTRNPYNRTSPQRLHTTDPSTQVTSLIPNAPKPNAWSKQPPKPLATKHRKTLQQLTPKQTNASINSKIIWTRSKLHRQQATKQSFNIKKDCRNYKIFKKPWKRSPKSIQESII
jgi:hypothetical protein